MRHRSKAGVTLLELLIAISLMSLLSVGILMALRVGLSATQKANTKLMANRRVAGAQRILDQQIAGFMPVVAACQPGPDQPPTKMPFFQGEPESMRFVSTYSIEDGSRGYPRILEFQVIPGENYSGVRLVVNEHLYTGPLGAGAFCFGMGFDPALGFQTRRFRPIQTGPSSFVLADRLGSCRFSYREILPPPALDRWVPRWVAPQWPSAVRIEMTPLSPDASRLQPVSMAAPIRVTRLPMAEYGY